MDGSELEEFIAASGLDERASEALRSLDSETQQEVINIGNLTNASNPSSALLGRIRLVKQQRRQGGPHTGGSYGIGAGGGGVSSETPAIEVTNEEVEAFIMESSLDDMAADALRGLTQLEQGLVIGKGTLSHAQNPSSAVMGRIRDVKRSNQLGGGAPNQMSMAVEQFIAESGVDPGSAEALRKLEPALQAEVINVGHLRNAKNPSSALQGRIKQIRQQFAGMGMGAGMNMGIAAGNGMGNMGSFMGGGLGGAMSGMGGGMQGMGMGGMQNGGMAEVIDPMFAMKVEQFLVQSGVDDVAVAKFRQLSQAEQEAVISIGHLQNAKNPSSALQGRIKQVQMQISQATGQVMTGMQHVGQMSGLTQGMSHPQQRTPTFQSPYDYVDPEWWLQDVGADERSASVFLTLTPEEQQLVINVGTLSNAANPSSAIMGRIKMVKNRGQTMMSHAVAPGSHSFNFVDFQDVHQFIADNGIDDKAAQDLLSLDSETQQAVMAKGVLTNAKNPSSALIGRIRQVSQELGRGQGQSARGAMQVQMQRQMNSGGLNEVPSVEEFIVHNSLDERASAALIGVDPMTQAEVMSLGSLANAQNPSSAVLGRIKQVQLQRRSSPY
eukprot:gnl/MRDRNA2_/MRDRNA2_107062_c0_seq1.p1 gnl/MRDRNA2_/MRDRNA2_107062_c0~~gnl/MRDRNA2_/MRDRNA2_107062_c0_seq1.p1  ORF type:complete len:608 (-),score=137.22 gnl/MRDRNA2_/MRDRNA2_107062_c0_seq1:160-1983(-)